MAFCTATGSSASSTKLLRQALQLPPALRRSFYATSIRHEQPELFDVICVGGGPAGLSLLSALRSDESTKDLKVALIDGQDLTSSRETSGPDVYSNRCSSLTPTSLRFLEGTGVWEHVNTQRIQPYHGMQVWDGVSGSKVSFDPLDAPSGFGGGLIDAVADLIPGSRFQESRRRDDTVADEGTIATMCENQNLTSALLQRLKDLGGVEILDKTRVDSIKLGPPAPQDDALTPDLSQWPVINLSGNRQLAARLLVGADGANSPVRTFADIPAHGWDYNQHGVVATLTLDHTLSDTETRTAYQRFLPTGPIALLPLPGNRASLVWSLTTPLAQQLKLLQPETFTAAVNAAFRLSMTDLEYLLTNGQNIDIADELSWRLPATPSTTTGLPIRFPWISSVQPQSIASFPLRLRHASTYTTHRVALIGDAAHTVHPLAGQGLNLGLADAESLARHIAYGVERGMDVGTNWCLDGYVAERWGRNNAVLGVCDKLQKLYSAESGPVVWGRSVGLGLVDRLGSVKGALIGAAGGAR